MALIGSGKDLEFDSAQPIIDRYVRLLRFLNMQKRTNSVIALISEAESKLRWHISTTS